MIKPEFTDLVKAAAEALCKDDGERHLHFERRKDVPCDAHIHMGEVVVRAVASKLEIEVEDESGEDEEVQRPQNPRHY